MSASEEEMRAAGLESPAQPSSEDHVKLLRLALRVAYRAIPESAEDVRLGIEAALSATAHGDGSER